jgi:dihydrofolate reductase
MEKIDAPSITMIAAVSRNSVIGKDNTLPWRLKTDLKRFKEETLGKPIIMGRKTYESLGRPLPGRTNIILTRSPEVMAAQDGIQIVSSLEQAIECAKKDIDERNNGFADICVIGGSEIYHIFMPLATDLKITWVETQTDGDAFFPKIEPSLWKMTSSQTFPITDFDEYTTELCAYTRIAMASSLDTRLSPPQM